MDKTNFRQIDIEVRADQANDERTITFVASDGTRDSEGTVLNPDGWDLDRFNKNSVIGYQHDIYSWQSDPDMVIGKGKAYVEDKKLMVDITFEPADMNPLAEKIYRKILWGSLHAVSVGFRPIGKGEWGKGDEAVSGSNPTYYYAGQELMEISVVNIPANPNAVVKSLDKAISEEMAALRAEAEAEVEPEQAPVEAPEMESTEPDPVEAPETNDENESAQKAASLEADIAIAIAKAIL